MYISRIKYSLVVLLLTASAGQAANCANLESILSRQSAEAAQLEARAKQYEGNDLGLCVFGENEGIPALERWIEETHAKGQCAAIADRTRKDYERILENHRKIVARDCERAGF